MKPVSLHLLIFAISLTAHLSAGSSRRASTGRSCRGGTRGRADVASETAPEDSQASTETPVSEGDAANSDTGSPVKRLRLQRNPQRILQKRKRFRPRNGTGAA